MATSFPPPPYRSTVTEKSGLLNWAWSKWFQDFFTSITGAVDNGVLESFDWQSAKDWAPAVSLEVQASGEPTRSYDQPIAELRAAAAFDTDYAGQLADRVAALENLVAALDTSMGLLFEQRIAALEEQLAIADPPRPPLLYLIQDTIAHQTNYPAASYPNVFYRASDTNNLYISDGTNWNLVN